MKGVNNVDQELFSLVITPPLEIERQVACHLRHHVVHEASHFQLGVTARIEHCRVALGFHQH